MRVNAAGITELTLMPEYLPSAASARVSPKMPALLDTYGLVNGVPNTEADDVGGDPGVVHQHLAPASGEGAGVRPSQPPPATGDDGHLVLEPQLGHGFVPPSDSNSV